MFANRSTKSQMGSPAIGRIRAVANPQNAIQSSANRMGLTRIRIARAMSIIPIIGKSDAPASAENPTEVKY